MKVIKAFPPNYAAINAAFNLRGRPGVIFCYGDRIYNPTNTEVGPELLAHESVHRDQQGSDPAGWWKRYIAEPHFRLQQEIPAHQAEYRAGGNLGKIAERLASPLYGSLITELDALAIVSRGALK